MVYLDNSATTPLMPEVHEVMSRVLHEVYANPSSPHTLGEQANQIIIRAQATIARHLSCNPGEICFTSGGTEANNLAIQGIAYAYKNRGRHLITTKVEHASVYEVFQALEQDGFAVTYLDVDTEGCISIQDLQAAIRDDTILVSLIHVNNELGSVQPIAEVGRILKEYRQLFYHVDAVQSFAKLKLHPADLGIDLLTISAHKFGGPKGIGCLYKRKNMRLKPLMYGGGDLLRPGTPVVASVAGMAQALILAAAKTDTFLVQAARLRKMILMNLEKLPYCWKLNGHPTNNRFVPYIFNLSFPGIRAEVMVNALAAEGVIVSSKAACSSKLAGSSRVLKAIGVSEEDAESAIRISIGCHNDETDIRAFIEAIDRVLAKLS